MELQLPSHLPMDKAKQLWRIIFFPEPKLELKWNQWKVFDPIVEFISRIRYRKCILITFQILLIVIFGILKLFSGDSLSKANGIPATKISCETALMGRGCGFNAQNCDPFESTFAIKCPSKCMMKRAWTPIYVGKQAIQYTSFVVGDEAYRGDSWICQAALHQGIIKNELGGCVMASLSPSKGETFTGVRKNGISSLDFNSTYPGVLRLSNPTSTYACGDMTTSSQIVFAFVLALLPFLGPSKDHFYVSVTIWTFAYWGFLSADVTNSVDDISEMMAAFIPYIAVMYSLYKLFLQDFLPEPCQFPIEMSILFFSSLWLGLYLDFLFELLPPLPPMSFDGQMFRNSNSAALIISVLVFIAILVVYYLIMQRKQHNLLNLVVSYGSGFPLYFLFRTYFQLVFHLHHYISALLLIPPVMVKNRFSLIVVAVLLGWYAQGVIKYGFDSPFDTIEGARSRNGRTFGTTGPIWTMNETSIRQGQLSWIFPFNSTYNITDLYKDANIPSGSPTAYSLYLNDIEVYRGKQASWNFTTDRDRNLQPNPNVMYYARVAPVLGSAVLDFGNQLEFQTGNGFFQEYAQFRN